MGFFNKLFGHWYDEMDVKQLRWKFDDALDKFDLQTCRKIILAYLKKQPNYEHIKEHAPLYVHQILQSIMNNGYGSDNDFLNFVKNIKTNKLIPFELMRLFFERGDLDSDDSFLYEETLYNDSSENNRFRLKSLVYAKNLKYQNDKVGNVNINMLINKDGTVKTTEEFEEIFSNIHVDEI